MTNAQASAKSAVCVSQCRRGRTDVRGPKAFELRRTDDVLGCTADSCVHACVCVRLSRWFMLVHACISRYCTCVLEHMHTPSITHEQLATWGGTTSSACVRARRCSKQTFPGGDEVGTSGKSRSNKGRITVRSTERHVPTNFGRYTPRPNHRPTPTLTVYPPSADNLWRGVSSTVPPTLGLPVGRSVWRFLSAAHRPSAWHRAASE